MCFCLFRKLHEKFDRISSQKLRNTRIQRDPYLSRFWIINEFYTYTKIWSFSPLPSAAWQYQKTQHHLTESRMTSIQVFELFDRASSLDRINFPVTGRYVIAYRLLQNVGRKLQFKERKNFPFQPTLQCHTYTHSCVTMHWISNEPWPGWHGVQITPSFRRRAPVAYFGIVRTDLRLNPQQQTI